MQLKSISEGLQLAGTQVECRCSIGALSLRRSRKASPTWLIRQVAEMAPGSLDGQKLQKQRRTFGLGELMSKLGP